MNYYRLKQIFTDGTYRYSAIRSLDFKSEVLAINVFPNPTADKIFVNLRRFLGKSATITIYNLVGQPIIKKKITEIQETPVSIDLAQLSTGLRHVNIVIEGNKPISKPILLFRE